MDELISSIHIEIEINSNYKVVDTINTYKLLFKSFEIDIKYGINKYANRLLYSKHIDELLFV